MNDIVRVHCNLRPFAIVIDEIGHNDNNTAWSSDKDSVAKSITSIIIYVLQPYTGTLDQHTDEKIKHSSFPFFIRNS